MEVREVVALLRGTQTEPRLLSLVLSLAGAGFVLAGKADTLDAGRTLAQEQIASGAAFAKLREMVTAQGGNAQFLDTHNPPPQMQVRASHSGYVCHIDALAVGNASMRLGAGRATKDDAIDPDAGLVLRVTMGQEVQAGDVLAHLWAQSEDMARAVVPAVSEAVTIGNAPVPEAPLLLETRGL